VSIVDRGGQDVQFYRETETVDGDGNPVKVPSTTPVVVSGRIQPAIGSVRFPGDASTVRFITRDVPEGSFSRVVFEGRDYDLLGEPQRQRGSSRTAHVTLLLRPRVPEANG
jgi:hypothetical protein